MLAPIALGYKRPRIPPFVASSGIIRALDGKIATLIARLFTLVNKKSQEIEKLIVVVGL